MISKIKNTVKKLKEKIVGHFSNGLDADWESFKLMSKDELKEEYDRLHDERPHSDRFRRLCMYISVHWVYDEDWK